MTSLSPAEMFEIVRRGYDAFEVRFFADQAEARAAAGLDAHTAA